MFDLIFVQTWPWWVSGPLIGLFVLAFFYFMGRPLGASSTYQSALEALRGQNDPDSLDFKGLGDKLLLPAERQGGPARWRVWFLAGLVLAGALDWALGGSGGGQLELPGLAETFAGLSLSAKAALLGVGGVLIGFGTRMSGGCTSGHAIFGISNRSLPSVKATLMFFATGMATTFIIQAVTQ